jgi:hypothetical protein
MALQRDTQMKEVLLVKISWFTKGKYNFTVILEIVTAKLKGLKRCSLASVP